ncbi:34450_t:CDS:2, partial [Racocetra persica]
QMKESLYYTASHSTIEEVESLTIYEPSQSKDVDDEPDAINLSAKYLLDHLEQNTIKEIRKLSRVTSSKINHFIFLLINGSYSCICLLQQKKDITSENNKCQFKWLQPFVNDESGEITNEVQPLVNPQKVVGKGRSKAASHKNTTNTTLQETGNKKKRGQYT